MKVERLDIFTFKVSLDPNEFTELKIAMNAKDMTIEAVLEWIFDYGVTFLVDDYK